MARTHIISWLIFVVFIHAMTELKCQDSDFNANNPLEITPILSGNFGELRPNHFHAGLDLKTGGKTGLPVHSVAPGYVSRIKISPYGYGKAVYITHENGYTTLFGHLDQLNDSIKRYARRIQYEQESFAIDVSPGKLDLLVKEDQIIAYSGNTGGSGGPHVHFEVRETDSEVPRNPLLFQFPLSDQKDPVIEAVAIVPLKPESKVEGRSTTQRFRVSSGKIAGHAQIETSGEIGIEISGYDQQDGAANRNGIFLLECFIDGQKYGRFVADSIPFDQSRYMNALIDYEHYYRTSQRFMRLYRLPGNSLENVWFKNNGYLNLIEGQHEVRIVASDFSGNSTTLEFTISSNSTTTKTREDNSELIPWNIDYFYESDKYKIHIPRGALYDNVELSLNEGENTLEILRRQIPIQKPFSIQIYSPEQRKGELIGLMNSSGKVSRVLVTKRNGNWLSAESKSFGTFGLTADVTPPVIRLGNFRNGMNVSNSSVTFDIQDNLSGIEKFEVHVDGKWVLAEYEPKENLLFINPMEFTSKSEEQHLSLRVVDMAGNVATFEGTFYKR